MNCYAKNNSFTQINTLLSIISLELLQYYGLDFESERVHHIFSFVKWHAIHSIECFFINYGTSNIWPHDNNFSEEYSDPKAFESITSWPTGHVHKSHTQLYNNDWTVDMVYGAWVCVFVHTFKLTIEF